MSVFPIANRLKSTMPHLFADLFPLNCENQKEEIAASGNTVDPIDKVVNDNCFYVPCFKILSRFAFALAFCK